MIAGQYCTGEGVFLKAEKFAYDTKMRYWTVFMALMKKYFMWFLMSFNLLR